uniref:RNA-dependent RNA polymerase n=1 Tax=Yunnan manyleaf rhizome virus TaxID=2544876 RepID=A0A6G5NJI6_9VIRU|nr:RNA-dependent RNA polymerase [Yunnan manyleaf rhizome virus]
MNSINVLHNILSSNTIITNEVFAEIVDACPPGLLSKLRLVPDAKLSSKLAHLNTVCRLAQKDIELGFEYDIIDIENMLKSSYMFDADAIIKNKSTNAICIIDCTARRSMYLEKMRKLQNIKHTNPGIDDVLVHVFNPKQYHIVVNKPVQLTGTSSGVFNLFDRIAMTSLENRTRFFTSCKKMYMEVNATIADKEYVDLTDRYATWNLSLETIDLASTLARSHSVADPVKFHLATTGNGARVYYETFEKILSQHNPIIKPCMHHPASLNTSAEMLSVLDSLSSNRIAMCLAAACRNGNNWCAVTFDGVVDMNPTVLGLRSSRVVIPSDSFYYVLARQRSAHLFSLKFASLAVDDNFKEQILGHTKFATNDKLYEGDVNEAMSEIFSDYNRYADEWFKPSVSQAKNTIVGKISTMSMHYATEGAMATRAASNILHSLAAKLSEYKITDLINHDYEVAKSFCASMKCSPHDDLYYVGVNGPFESITVTRLSSTQDSFTTASYFVIYRTPVELSLSSVRDIFYETNSIVQSKTRTFNKNSLAHALRIPMYLFSLMTWELENIHDTDQGVKISQLMNICANSFLHISVNNDQFSQCAEQIRYLFTSNVGVGAKSEDICKKIDFIKPRTMWELIYIFRMLKLAAGLNILFKTKSIQQVIEKQEFKISFPNSVLPVTSFSHLVSSMYYANIYNKFRAFHEVSEAICYNELNQENLIYMAACNTRLNEVLGISPLGMFNLQNLDTCDYEDLIKTEVQFCKTLMESGPDRFKLSILYVIGATASLVNVRSENISSVYHALSVAPIEACTMRGAMETGNSKREHQGVRAATAMLEELMEEMNLDPMKIKDDKLGFLDIKNKLLTNDFDFSILSATARQMVHRGHYSYRVVQKDQKGHREISVLNSKFRIGALFTEKISHDLSQLVPGDVLDNSSKDVVVESAVRKLMKDKDVTFVLSDNSDQKRWGPNHLLHSFSAMFLALLQEDMGLFRLVNTVLHYGENKRAKFPESLIDLAFKTGFVSRSAPIKKFFDEQSLEMSRGVFDRKFEWGMCQGIFHRTSSLYHGIMCMAVNEIAQRSVKIPKHDVYSFVTSDDAERLFAFKENLIDRIAVSRRLHSIIVNVGSLMNILRNESKSVFTPHITEFNSIFYHHGVLATPTLKQRISKIDIGDGHDHVLDYITTVSLAMGYYQNGGSYAGASIMTILNMVLHTEQWRRWSVFSRKLKDRPVEFGGLPVIEPLSTMICGPISSIFLKSIRHCNPDTYSYLITDSTLTSAMAVDLNESLRTRMSEDDLSGHYVLKAAGPLGFVSLARTDRRLSRFERRHKLSQWSLPESFITLRQKDSSARKFLFNLMRITRTAQFESSVGVNSFFLRMSDPWINRERPILKLHPNHIMTKSLFPSAVDDMVSFDFVEGVMESKTDKDIDEFFESLEVKGQDIATRNEIRVRLGMLMKDTSDIYNTLNSIQEVKPQMVENKNSIIKINLAATVSLDENEFHYALLKSVVGEPVKQALIEKTKNANIWDRIIEIPNIAKMEPIEGIFHCSNIIQAYEKFARQSTKLICPGEDKPVGLSDLMEKMLRFKFTETCGATNIRFQPLDSSVAPPFAFFNHNRRLLEHTKKMWEKKEMNLHLDFMEEDSKIGIETDRDVITHSDAFNIDERITVDRKVFVDTRGKYNFVQRLLLWSSAKVKIMLSAITMKSLLDNELTNFHEYALDAFNFVKNQTGVALKVTASGTKCFEIQSCQVRDNKVCYFHDFLFMSTSVFFPVTVELAKPEDTREWVAKLGAHIRKQEFFTANQPMEIRDNNGNVTDVVRFLPMNPTMEFSIRTIPMNLTVFLHHEETGLDIPVCSLQQSKTLDINMRFCYTDEDIDLAFVVFKELSTATDYFEEFNPETKKLLCFLLFRSSAMTDVVFLNKLLVKANFVSKLPSKESADLLRSMVLCDMATELKCNRPRIKHHFLNIFRSSPSYNNGIVGVTFDEISLQDEADEDGFTGDPEDAAIDMTIPDKAIWAGNDQDDLFFMGSTQSATPVVSMDQDFSFLDAAPAYAEHAFNFFDAMDDETEDNTDAAQGFDAITKEVTELPQIRSIVKTGEVADSHVVNVHLEDCSHMVEWIRKYSLTVKQDKKPRGYFQEAKTFCDTIRAFTSGTLISGREASRTFRSMYTNRIPFRSLKVPMSILCINELAFN